MVPDEPRGFGEAREEEDCDGNEGKRDASLHDSPGHKLRGVHEGMSDAARRPPLARCGVRLGQEDGAVRIAQRPRCATTTVVPVVRR